MNKMYHSGNQYCNFKPINLQEYFVICRNLEATHMQQRKQ
jgi:hypothetical protein